MGETIIPLADLRYAAAVPRVPAVRSPPAGLLSDALGRPLRDLRISVTDRCNFRCSYCMPKDVFDKDYKFLPQTSLLNFEEITRLARVFVGHGVRKLRLTGGEPLLRKNLEVLIRMLAELRTPDGQPLDITLTTNGSLLARKAQALKEAGLRRVTVSLDALDDAIFRRMNDVDFPVADVLQGIETALQVGFSPIKVNMVVKRGTNDHEIVPLARHVRERFGPAWCCASSSTWTSVRPMAGAWTRCCRPRTSCACSTRTSASSRSKPPPPARRLSAGATGMAAARSV
jgi:cyclic pyranopterin phosphate synthase